MNKAETRLSACGAALSLTCPSTITNRAMRMKEGKRGLLACLSTAIFLYILTALCMAVWASVIQVN